MARPACRTLRARASADPRNEKNPTIPAGAYRVRHRPCVYNSKSPRMNAPAPPSEEAARLRRDALGWFVCRQDAAWALADERAFQAWLSASALHGEAYQSCAAPWQTLDAMPDDLRARMRGQLARDKAALERAPRRSAPRSRRRFLQPLFAAAGAAAVLGGVGYVAWQQLLAQPRWTQAFATERGQQKDIPLPDGSRLRLDTATRIEVVFYRQRREVRLREGQAVFAVQPDASRPFDVLAGPLRVTVVGTRFSVRHTPGQSGHDGVTVAVAQGKVRVARADAPAGQGDSSVLLTPGQQVASDAQGALGPVGPVPAAGIAPWREQRLSFTDVPLGQALEELARYGRTGLVVRDPQVAALRLTGTFDPMNRATLRLALPRVLPVRLQQDGRDTEVLLAR